MQGIVVHMLIGLVLFTPIGFLAGYYQNKKRLRKEAEAAEEQKLRETDN
jgi:hypothetical protein